MNNSINKTSIFEDDFLIMSFREINSFLKNQMNFLATKFLPKHSSNSLRIALFLLIWFVGLLLCTFLLLCLIRKLCCCGKRKRKNDYSLLPRTTTNLQSQHHSTRFRVGATNGDDPNEEGFHLVEKRNKRFSQRIKGMPQANIFWFKDREISFCFWSQPASHMHDSSWRRSNRIREPMRDLKAQVN